MIGDLISIICMASALGMDAFSVSLALGMQKIRLKRIAFIGFVIGLFHIFMPLVGIIIGQAISGKIGQYAILISGLLLVGIGVHMLLSAFNHETKTIVSTAGFGLFLFGISVSMDSFSVGLSLGLSEVKTVLVIIIFGTISMMLTWLGLFFGRKVHGLLGAYSEILGGSTLLTFGLLVIFGT